MEPETAGDPISGLKWTRKTTAKIARQLKRLRIVVSRNTVGRLLWQMKYSLHTNRKQITTGSSPGPTLLFWALRKNSKGDAIYATFLTVTNSVFVAAIRWALRRR
jgi:hypothetical protein